MSRNLVLRPERPDPDVLLRQVQAQEERERRGKLKVFLGYASGVGKSLRMLDEGRRRRERGEDVVVGATQPYSTPEAKALLAKLEVIPLRLVEGVPVMDVDAILRRNPGVCLVDGLGHDNPPGSGNAHRWQDVEQLLDAGINVITSVNLQYIDEERERVAHIRGKEVQESVPLALIKSAEEIEVVDVTEEACLQQEQDGADGDCDRLHRQQQLAQLREIALLLAASVVDHQLERYLQEHGIEQLWSAHERFLVWLTPQTDAARMLASGRRNALRFHGELIAVYVARPDMTPGERAVLERNLGLARQAGATLEALDGEDPADTILDFARHRGVTQIFAAHTDSQNWWDRVFGGAVDRLIRDAEGIDVRIFPQ
jgi:two-component system, OmpR family, sensor histidine kinase KdpD